MQYVVQLVQALAWPVVVLIIAVVFRGEFRGLIARLTKMKYKEIEAEFKEGLAATAEQAALQAPATISVEGATSPKALGYVTANPRVQTLERIASVSPRAAVTEAWTMLETTMRDAVVKRGGDGRRMQSPLQLLAELRQTNSVPRATVNSIDTLRELRNKVVHASEFTPDLGDALLYVHMATDAIEMIENALNQNPDGS